MAAAGALFSLWLFDQTWNIFSQIGTVMLIGLVTKNGILIVSLPINYANRENQTGSYFRSFRSASSHFNDESSYFIALPIAMSLGAASTSRIEWEW
jgi:HAE1 family hydrophobic/amphiphilic exporter-1/multidrug efflux pump